VRETCQRIVTIQQPSPVLRRLGGLVIYFSPEKQAAHLRCRNMGAWTTNHLVLQGPGLLEGAQSCQISLGNLQLYAEIRGSSQFDATSEALIITPQVPVTSDGELQALRKVMDTHSLDQLIAKVNAHKMEADLADLVKLDPHSTTNSHKHTLDYAFVAGHFSGCNFGNILLLYVYTRQGVDKMLRQERITQSNP